MASADQAATRLYGGWERPRNIAADRRGSIHDDDAARRLGFRGAFVSGRVHLNVFVPVLLEAYGRHWFEDGTISVEFRHGTLDAEEVRAGLEVAGTRQAGVLLETRQSDVVARGTASCGETGEPTWLGRKNLAGRDEGGYALVSAVTPGDAFSERVITLSDAAAERMAAGAVRVAWYAGASPWGPPIVSPALMVNALGVGCTTYLRDHPVRGVAIDGATELRNVGGPVFLGRPYRVGGRIVARGRSPRTEYFWYESWLDDEQDGRRVAEMLLQWRCARG